MIIRHPYPIVQEGEAVRAAKEIDKLAAVVGFGILITGCRIAMGDRPGQVLRDAVGKDLSLSVSEVHQLILLPIHCR
ncbi:hypothetical protein D3C78_1033640 [compost metagenome]